MEKYKFQQYEHQMTRGRGTEDGVTLHKTFLMFVGNAQEYVKGVTHISIQFDRLNQAFLVTPTAPEAPNALAIKHSKTNPTVQAQLSKMFALGLYKMVETTPEGFLFKLSERRDYKS